jgi:hypothetical protein
VTPRFNNWPTRLDAYLATRRAMPFAWGRQDCCLFVADAVQAIWGVDPAQGLRGYRSAAGAARIVKRLGGIERIGATRFGAACPVLAAQVGDVGLVHTDGRDSLALCAGSHWLAAGEQGLESLPLDAARCAWRGC